MNDTAIKFPISSAYEYDTIKKDGTPWQPRLFRRAPWSGLLALLGALLGILAGAVVLYISNGQPTEEWRIKPTVYLAICSAITNILVHFSFTQAMTVAWWKRALQTDATVGDLHRSWDYGQNLGAALTSGRHFSLVALASILVALAPVNGPLLQRASQIESLGQTYRNFTAKIDIATEIPEGEHASPAGLSQRSQVDQSDEGDPLQNGTDVFATEFVWSGGKFNINVQYKESNDCGGSLMVRNCTFHPAVITSHVSIKSNEPADNGPSTGSWFNIAQTSGDSYMSKDRLVRLVELPPDSGTSNTESNPKTSTYGGLFKALKDAYTSSVHLSHGPSGYQISSVGSLGSLFWDIPGGYSQSYEKRSEPPGLDCSMSFHDPTDYIKKGVRDLMFRTAMFKTIDYLGYFNPLNGSTEDHIPSFPAK
ncbi:MAG: hypothetical protein Q9174_005562 [Haloplaca sp. 1 TL-2023]